MDVIYISKGTHEILMSIQNRVKVLGPGNWALESFCHCMPETKTWQKQGGGHQSEVHHKLELFPWKNGYLKPVILFMH